MTPTIVQKRAIDVTPHNHGIWCSVASRKLFVNDIVHKRWNDDETKIWFMLDTHNFLSAAPDELIDVVEVEVTDDFRLGLIAAFKEQFARMTAQQSVDKWWHQ